MFFRILAFAMSIGIFFGSVVGSCFVPGPGQSVKATGAAEISIELLLKLVGGCGKDYVEDRVMEQLDPSYYHDVVSSSSYPNWSNPDSVKKYIDGKGDIHQLSSTWNELYEQYKLHSGVVDKEYYQAFYEALINNIVDDTNVVLDEVHNEYVNSPFNYSKLSDDEIEAFKHCSFYVIVQKRYAETGTYDNDFLYMFFCSDLHFGTLKSYRCKNDVYYYNYGLVDVDYYSRVRLSNGLRYFSSSVASNTVITNLSLTSDHARSFYYQNGILTKIDGETVSYDAEHETGNGTFSGGFQELYSDGSVFDGYVIKNVGITPLGHSYLKNGGGGVELQRTLNKYKDIENPLPIFKLKPDSPGTDFDDYVGNVDDTVVHIDYDNDISPQFLTGDDDTVVLQNEGDLNNLDTSPVDKNDAAKKKWGWLSFLFEWFQKIIDAILSLINGIVDGILNGLKSLFIPSDDFFTSNFDSLKDKLADKFGFSDYELFFDALKNCAKGVWNFKFEFNVLGHEYNLEIAHVDEWFEEKNLSKIHFLMRGFFYPLIILANVNYMTWFLRGTYLISPGGGKNSGSSK